MLYCVINSRGDIIGRFKDRKRAFRYLMDCWFDGMEEVKLKTFTKEEYLKMMEEYLNEGKGIK